MLARADIFTNDFRRVVRGVFRAVLQRSCSRSCSRSLLRSFSRDQDMHLAETLACAYLWLGQSMTCLPICSDELQRVIHLLLGSLEPAKEHMICRMVDTYHCTIPPDTYQATTCDNNSVLHVIFTRFLCSVNIFLH